MSFSCRIRQCFCSSTIRSVPCAHFLHQQTIVQTLLRMSSLSGCMNIVRINIEFFTGCKKFKQQRISFVLGYLRMILWKISTAISIKHRILATFNMKKKIQHVLWGRIFFFSFTFSQYIVIFDPQLSRFWLLTMHIIFTCPCAITESAYRILPVYYI